MRSGQTTAQEAWPTRQEVLRTPESQEEQGAIFPSALRRRQEQAECPAQRRRGKASSPSVRGWEGMAAEVRSGRTTLQEARPPRREACQIPESQKEQLNRARQPRPGQARELLLKKAAELRAIQGAKFADQMKEFRDSVGPQLGFQEAAGARQLGRGRLVCRASADVRPREPVCSGGALTPPQQPPPRHHTNR